MTYSLLTYNVLYNKAFVWLEKIITAGQPDIVCLQEVETDESNLLKLEKFGYKLADYSNTFIQFGKIYGIATYYRPGKLKLIKTDSFNIPKSFYEAVLAFFKFFQKDSQPRTILRTDFLESKTRSKFAVYNLHLSLYGINRTRTKQLSVILNHGIREIKLPTIICGDFNYFPYRRRNLEKLMKEYGFLEATRNIGYTIRYPSRSFTRYSFLQELAVKLIRKYFKGRLKIDYIFFKKLKLVKSERIELKFSDHFPVISTFQI